MQKYLKIFTLSAFHALNNKKALVGLSIFLITCLLIFSNLWKIIAAKTGAFNLNPNELLWYIALNEWVIISLPRPEREIEVDLRTGKLAYSLPKPMSYLFSVFSESIGQYLINLIVLGFVAFSFTWFFAGPIPIPLAHIPFVIFITLLAGAVAICFQMIIGVAGFWIAEVESLNWLWEKLLFAFGGLILPLSVYPELLQTIARFTPFPYILGARSALAIDSSIGLIFSISAALVAWGLFAVLALTYLFRKGLKILNMEGG